MVNRAKKGPLPKPASKKTAAKKSAPAKATPKKATPKKATPKKAASTKAAPVRFGELEQRLALAAERGNMKDVRSLLSSGAFVRAAEPRTGTSALHQAARNGRLEVVRALLKAGADVEAPLRNALTTPLGLAIYAGHLGVVEHLLGAGARHDVLFDRTRHTALHAAVGTASLELVRALLRAGADPNARSQSGNTVLASAIIAAHDGGELPRMLKIIEALVGAGADLTGPAQQDGQNAAQLAEDLGRDRVLPILRKLANKNA